MSHKGKIQNESERLRAERDLYVKLLKEANLRFEEKVNELSLLKRMGDIMRYAFDLELFCKKLTDIIIEDTNAENCSLLLTDPYSNKLILKVAKGSKDETSKYFEELKDSKVVFSIGEGIAGKVALEGKPILINDVKNDERFDQSKKSFFPIGSLLCAPFVSQEQVLGVINISNSQPHAFSNNDVRVMFIFSAFATSILKNVISYRELKESEEKFRAIFEGARDALLIIDPVSGKIIDCNKKTEDWLGYTKKELLHENQILDKLLPEHSILIIQYFNEVLKNAGEESIREISFVRKDGSARLGEMKISDFRYQGRNLVQLAMRDITERKGMEEKLFRSEKLKALGELAGGVAHDFNNVLAAILGRVQLLRIKIETPLGEKERRESIHDLRKGLEVIEKATSDGAETVRRIQEFSRRRSDDKNFTQVNINELLEHALEFTRMKWKDEAESKGIKIKIKKEFSYLPPTAGSASELREVFINLINNAVDAMPQGGQITIQTVKENNRICIKVEDEGIGIPDSIKDRVFDPFFTTKGPQSSGLGMSVSYGIISRHQGIIAIDSVESEKTAFTIELPISEKTSEEEQVKPVPKSQRRARVLVIEDEEEVGQLLSDILVEGGHKVEVLSSGKEGIELFQARKFDLVFTDLGMPGISGWQVAEEIKKINKDTPVALITGWEVQQNEVELNKRGVDFMVQKPFQLDQVLRLVQEGMELREKAKRK